jgi:hypothetical protein
MRSECLCCRRSHRSNALDEAGAVALLELGTSGESLVVHVAVNEFHELEHARVCDIGELAGSGMRLAHLLVVETE